MLPSAFAQESIVMEQIIENGQVKVQIEWPEVEPDEIYDIPIKFLDPQTDELMDNVSIEYSVSVTQENEQIELFFNETTNTGLGTFGVLFPEKRNGQAQVYIEVYSITDDLGTIILDEYVTFSVIVVPEFEAVAVAVLAASIAGVIILGRTKIQNVKFRA